MPRNKRHRSRLDRLIRYLADNPQIVAGILQIVHATICVYALRSGLGMHEMPLQFLA